MKGRVDPSVDKYTKLSLGVFFVIPFLPFRFQDPCKFFQNPFHVPSSPPFPFLFFFPLLFTFTNPPHWKKKNEKSVEVCFVGIPAHFGKLPRKVKNSSPWRREIPVHFSFVGRYLTQGMSNKSLSQKGENR